jgi:DUF4097 and DUF4098 domain-containing protein YvlB
MKNKSNKGLLIFLIVFLSIIVLALSTLMVLGISGKGGMFGWHFGSSNISSNLVAEKEISAEDIDNIKIRIKAGKLKVTSEETSEDAKIIAKIYAKEKDWVSFDNSDSSIDIEDRSEDCRFFCVNWDGINVELFVPKDYVGDFDVDTSYGDIEIGDFALATMRLDSSAGNIKLGSAKNVSAELSAGNFELGNCYGRAKIDNSMGNVEIDHLDISEDSAIELSMGNVEIRNIGDVRVDAETDMGNSAVDGGNPKADVVLRIENSMGNITVR